MGTFSIWHWLIVLVVVLVLFGRGKIPALMGDMAKGIKAFKTGMKEDPQTADDSSPGASPKQIDDTVVNDAAGAAVNKEKAAEG